MIEKVQQFKFLFWLITILASGHICGSPNVERIEKLLHADKKIYEGAEEEAFITKFWPTYVQSFLTFLFIEISMEKNDSVTKDFKLWLQNFYCRTRGFSNGQDGEFSLGPVLNNSEEVAWISVLISCLKCNKKDSTELLPKKAWEKRIEYLLEKFWEEMINKPFLGLGESDGLVARLERHTYAFRNIMLGITNKDVVEAYCADEPASKIRRIGGEGAQAMASQTRQNKVEEECTRAWEGIYEEEFSAFEKEYAKLRNKPELEAALPDYVKCLFKKLLSKDVVPFLITKNYIDYSGSYNAQRAFEDLDLSAIGSKILLGYKNMLLHDALYDEIKRAIEYDHC